MTCNLQGAASPATGSVRCPPGAPLQLRPCYGGCARSISLRNMAAKAGDAQTRLNELVAMDWASMRFRHWRSSLRAQGTGRTELKLRCSLGSASRTRPCAPRFGQGFVLQLGSQRCPMHGSCAGLLLLLPWTRCRGRAWVASSVSEDGRMYVPVRVSVHSQLELGLSIELARSWRPSLWAGNAADPDCSASRPKPASGPGTRRR